jgi:hypothetical protein
MWSKSDVKPVPPDTSIDRPENESIAEMLMGAIRESDYAKEQPLEDREPAPFLRTNVCAIRRGPREMYKNRC